MLSLFPQILFLQPIGLTLIRIAAGITFLWLAQFYYMERAEVSRVRVPILKHTPQWLLILGSIILLATGAALIVGYLTQLAAIFGAIAALKSAVFDHRYPQAIPLSRTASLLLLAVCLCLLVSGAGAFAFDLPL